MLHKSGKLVNKKGELIMGLSKIASTGMSKVLSNGKKVLIEDAVIFGKSRRNIAVFDKEGNLLSQRVKFYVNREPELRGMGTRFCNTRGLITIDSRANAVNDFIRINRINTDYTIALDAYSPSRLYPDIDANGNKTALFDIFTSRREAKGAIDGKARFNLDGSLVKPTVFYLDDQKKFFDSAYKVKLNYPPVHSPHIDKWC